MSRSRPPRTCCTVIQEVDTPVPQVLQFARWLQVGLRHERCPTAYLTIRIVCPEESAALNTQYRSRPNATNILSFPADPSCDTHKRRFLGDLIYCAAQIRTEAGSRQIPEMAHWAHLTVHGLLHLLGYDHGDPIDAVRMESREIQILQKLRYTNPYALPLV